MTNFHRKTKHAANVKEWLPRGSLGVLLTAGVLLLWYTYRKGVVFRCTPLTQLTQMYCRCIQPWHTCWTFKILRFWWYSPCTPYWLWPFQAYNLTRGTTLLLHLSNLVILESVSGYTCVHLVDLNFFGAGTMPKCLSHIFSGIGVLEEYSLAWDRCTLRSTPYILCCPIWVQSGNNIVTCHMEILPYSLTC